MQAMISSKRGGVVCRVFHRNSIRLSACKPKTSTQSLTQVRRTLTDKIERRPVKLLKLRQHISRVLPILLTTTLQRCSRKSSDLQPVPSNLCSHHLSRASHQRPGSNLSHSSISNNLPSLGSNQLPLSRLPPLSSLNNITIQTKTRARGRTTRARSPMQVVVPDALPVSRASSPSTTMTKSEVHREPCLALPCLKMIIPRISATSSQRSGSYPPANKRNERSWWMPVRLKGERQKADSQLNLIVL